MIIAKTIRAKTIRAKNDNNKTLVLRKRKLDI
jgi:hypothetical protein